MKSIFPKVVLGGMALVAGGALIYKFRHKIKNLFLENDAEEEHNPSEDAVIFPKDDFIKNASKFTGTYEILYKVSQGLNVNQESVDGLYQDLELRIKGIDCPELLLWWEKTKESGQKKQLVSFLDRVFSSGVIRDSNSELIVDDAMRLYYIEWDDLTLENGESVKVIVPAWRIHNSCIEQGLVAKKQS